MIDRILALAADPSAEAELRREIAEMVRGLRASAGGSDPGVVARVEKVVHANPPAAFRFDRSGLATLTVADQTWQAGRFETPSIADLRRRVKTGTGGSLGRLWVFDGASPATDIGSLQATAGDRSLFQVASQFNCLESPGAHVTPVAYYFSDPTQGPRASISAFPATLLRHYAAPGPGGERFCQATDQQQVDLLADVFGPGKSPVRNGYLADHGGMGATTLATALEAGFDRIRVGVHDAAQVVLGFDWDGAVENAGQRQVTQVLTSTVAGGYYGGESALGESFKPACRQLLRAAYLGTLLAAVALRRTPAVLTLSGGGVFGNPVGPIWESILWAFDEVQPFLSEPLEVVLNGYNLSRLTRIEQILPDVTALGGAVLQFDGEGLVRVRR